MENTISLEYIKINKQKKTFLILTYMFRKYNFRFKHFHFDSLIPGLVPLSIQTHICLLHHASDIKMKESFQLFTPVTPERSRCVSSDFGKTSLVCFLSFSPLPPFGCCVSDCVSKLPAKQSKAHADFPSILPRPCLIVNASYI